MDHRCDVQLSSSGGVVKQATSVRKRARLKSFPSLHLPLWVKGDGVGWVLGSQGVSLGGANVKPVFFPLGDGPGARVLLVEFLAGTSRTLSWW